MKFCPDCRIKRALEANFCSNCGFKFSKTMNENKAPRKELENRNKKTEELRLFYLIVKHFSFFEKCGDLKERLHIDSQLEVVLRKPNIYFNYSIPIVMEEELEILIRMNEKEQLLPLVQEFMVYYFRGEYMLFLSSNQDMKVTKNDLLQSNAFYLLVEKTAIGIGASRPGVDYSEKLNKLPNETILTNIIRFSTREDRFDYENTKAKLITLALLKMNANNTLKPFLKEFIDKQLTKEFKYPNKAPLLLHLM